MSNVMLLYKQVEALSQETHKQLKLKAAADYHFADHTHWFPVAGTEFFSAAQDYPIVFAPEGEGKDQKVTAIVLTGLESGHNDYVMPDKQWRADTYIPAFVRRYPFILATTEERGGKQASNSFMVCFDASFPGFNKEEGMPLFHEDGTASALLNDAVEFMNGFHNDLERTREFVATLRRMELLERRTADVQSADGKLFQIKDILMVDERKLAKLSGAKLAALQRKGFLGWIYAHLMSLANFPLLLNQHLIRTSTKKS